MDKQEFGNLNAGQNRTDAGFSIIEMLIAIAVKRRGLSY